MAASFFYRIVNCVLYDKKRSAKDAHSHVLYFASETLSYKINTVDRFASNTGVGKQFLTPPLRLKELPNYMETLILL